MEEEIAMPRIIIVKNPNGCFIRQPHTLAKKGDTVTFSAVNTDAKINFPGSTPFVDGANYFEVKRGETKEAIIRNNDDAYGTHPFSGFCEECNTFAVGGSFGELVVGP